MENRFIGTIVNNSVYCGSNAVQLFFFYNNHWESFCLLLNDSSIIRFHRFMLLLSFLCLAVWHHKYSTSLQKKKSYGQLYLATKVTFPLTGHVSSAMCVNQKGKSGEMCCFREVFLWENLKAGWVPWVLDMLCYTALRMINMIMNSMIMNLFLRGKSLLLKHFRLLITNYQPPQLFVGLSRKLDFLNLCCHTSHSPCEWKSNLSHIM